MPGKFLPESFVYQYTRLQQVKFGISMFIVYSVGVCICVDIQEIIKTHCRSR